MRAFKGHHAVMSELQTILAPRFASLANLGAIDPGSVSLRLSGLGEVAVRFDPQNNTATYRARALTPGKYTVILTAKSQGQRIESRWSFTVAPGGGAPVANATVPSP